MHAENKPLKIKELIQVGSQCYVNHLDNMNNLHKADTTQLWHSMIKY